MYVYPRSSAPRRRRASASSPSRSTQGRLADKIQTTDNIRTTNDVQTTDYNTTTDYNKTTNHIQTSNIQTNSRCNKQHSTSHCV